MTGSSAHTEKQTALISGAGPAGLTLALLLSRAGWQAIVVEKDQQLRGGGFLVSLADSAYHCIDDLGLATQLRERGSGITQSIYYDGDQRALLRLQTQHLFGDLPVIQLMRDDLTDVLYQAATQEADILMGTSVSQIDQAGHSVNVTLSSGASVQADLVVGADGVHSNVRQLAFPTESVTERYLDLHCAAFRHRNVAGLDRCFETHTQRKRYMATFTTRTHDVGSVFVWTDDLRQVDQAEQTARLINAFQGSAGRTAQHLEQCPDTPFYYDVLKQIELSRWYHNRVVLLGDAAHCLTLFSGRGAAAAVNDAYVLANTLRTNHDIPTALSQYDQTLRPNLNRMQTSTRRHVRWYVPGNAMDYTLRNLAFRLVPAGFFHRFFQHKYSTVGSG